MIYGWKTDTFLQSWLGRKKRSPNFCLTVFGGEGTERGGTEGCVTVLYRGRAQERVAL